MSKNDKYIVLGPGGEDKKYIVVEQENTLNQVKKLFDTYEKAQEVADDLNRWDK